MGSLATGLAILLRRQLSLVEAIDDVPNLDYAYQKLGKTEVEPLTTDETILLGRTMEARRVISSSFDRSNGLWHVTSRVLNVATEKWGSGIVAESENWFELQDKITQGVLAQIGVSPTDVERVFMRQRLTKSRTTLESLVKAVGWPAKGRPCTDFQSELDLAALETSCATAQLWKAACLGSQGKLAEARELCRFVIHSGFGRSAAHVQLAECLLLDPALSPETYETVEEELTLALQMEPKQSNALQRYGELRAQEDRSLEAAAFFRRNLALNPLSAACHAQLAHTLLVAGNKVEAATQLREAERLSTPDDPMAEQFLGNTYLVMGQQGAAIEHFEKCLRLAAKADIRLDGVNKLREIVLNLKASLKPSYVNAEAPRGYSDPELRSALREKLSEQEIALVANPLACTPEMAQWAARITARSKSPLEKGRALYESLTDRIVPGDGGARTAEETFSVWMNRSVPLWCQEYARLYVSLARSLGMNAYFCLVARDVHGMALDHACAALIVDKKVLLVDPSYRWFGVPHQEFELVDDFEAVVLHLNQSKNPHLQRLALRLAPRSSMSMFNLAQNLIDAGQDLDQGWALLAQGLKLSPDGFQSDIARAALQHHAGKLEEALDCLRRAAQRRPFSGVPLLNIGAMLMDKGRPAEGREELRKALRLDLTVQQTEIALARLAVCNEMVKQ